MMHLKYFESPYCPVCKEVWPRLEARAKRSGTRLEKFNVVKHKDCVEANKYYVRNFPTLVVLNGETVIKVYVGTNVLKWGADA